MISLRAVNSKDKVVYTQHFNLHHSKVWLGCRLYDMRDLCRASSSSFDLDRIIWMSIFCAHTTWCSCMTFVFTPHGIHAWHLCVRHLALIHYICVYVTRRSCMTFVCTPHGAHAWHLCVRHMALMHYICVYATWRSCMTFVCMPNGAHAWHQVIHCAVY